MELPRHQQTQHTAAITTMSNGHAHGGGHAQPHHHRQTSSNGGHPTEKTGLMQQARSAYRLNDVEASRCVRACVRAWLLALGRRVGMMGSGVVPDRLATDDLKPQSTLHPQTQGDPPAEVRGQGARRDARLGGRLREVHDLRGPRRHPDQLCHRRGRGGRAAARAGGAGAGVFQHFCRRLLDGHGRVPLLQGAQRVRAQGEGAGNLVGGRTDGWVVCVWFHFILELETDRPSVRFQLRCWIGLQWAGSWRTSGRGRYER